MKIRNAQLHAKRTIQGYLNVEDDDGNMYSVYIIEERVGFFNLTWDKEPPQRAQDLVLELVTTQWKE